MIKIVSNAEMRAMDDYTIKKLGIPGIVLMENAGRSAYEVIAEYLESSEGEPGITVFCGKGNNGGDGYVIARHLYNDGWPVQIYSVGDPKNLSGDAKTNYEVCKNIGLMIKTVSKKTVLKGTKHSSLIIDALFGTGIKGAAENIYKDCIDYMNSSGIPVISIDIPSGLNGDSAAIPGPVVWAMHTVTMALPKRAHLFFPAREMVGNLTLVDIGMPESVTTNDKVILNLFEDEDVELPEILTSAHKYSMGKLLIVAGSRGMTGAAILAARAALRNGCGLVHMAVPESLNITMETKVTEALTVPLTETETGSLGAGALPELINRIEWADAVLMGPGCGRHAETSALLLELIKVCRKQDKPTVLDADALFALTLQRETMAMLTDRFVLTPHHGEFLRLSGGEKEGLQSTPWEALYDFIRRYPCICNLKGAPSIVARPDGQIFVNSSGNPGLATGGSGDVLSGIIAALMARKMDPAAAAITGNYLHGLAADELTEDLGTTAQLPTDLLDVLPKIIKRFETVD